MDSADGSERERRGAYATYVRLQWLLYELPRDHPSRQHLMLAVAAADRHWRRLDPGGDSPPSEDLVLTENLGLRDLAFGEEAHPV
jgi:hypothetical protein